MAVRTIKSGMSAGTETSLLQLLTDLLQASGIANIGGTQFQVAAQSSPNMTVQVAPGHAYLLVSSGNGYPVNSDSIINVTINANGSGNPRITSIVLFFNTGASANADASNVASVIAVDGTPAASPSAPSNSQIQTAIGSSSYPYTVISNILVASGATSIINGNITDTRQAALFSFGSDGWVTLSGTLTYASTDGHIFVVNTSADLTGVIQAGDKIKVVNQGVTQKFFVHAITSSTLTLYGGQNYSLTNTAITNPFYSHNKSPFGFPLDPTLWSESTIVNTDNFNFAPSAGAFANPGSIHLDIPIGAWRASYSTPLTGNYGAAQGTISIYSALSTSTSSVTDGDLASYSSYADQNPQIKTLSSHHSREKYLVTAVKTTYNLVCAIGALGGSTSVGFEGSKANIIIRVVSAYL